jgi:hypothetical protein
LSTRQPKPTESTDPNNPGAPYPEEPTPNERILALSDEDFIAWWDARFKPITIRLTAAEIERLYGTQTSQEQPS